MNTDKQTSKRERPRIARRSGGLAGTRGFLRAHPWFLFVFFLAGCVVTLSVRSAPPSRTGPSVVKGFRVPQFFEAPYETQMKTLLEGAEAEPQPGGLIWITEFKLQTFNESGARELTVTAPHCIFDSSRQTVSSAGPLQMRTADGNLLLSGEGFFWQQNNSTLVISNRVSTLIRGPLNNSLMP
jgi:hypothetical protein